MQSLGQQSSVLPLHQIPSLSGKGESISEHILVSDGECLLELKGSYQGQEEVFVAQEVVEMLQAVLREPHTTFLLLQHRHINTLYKGDPFCTAQRK